MARVFVTGDTHGALDILKLTGKYWPEGRTLSRDDYLIICGDFGLVWSDPASAESAFWLDWLEARPWTTLFVDGNHENHDLLDSFAISTWCGGNVHRLPGRPHVIHLMRGESYEVAGHGTWFVFGGARSQDREWRVEGRSWWAREMPSEEEYDRGIATLESLGWAPDYIFSHDCPADRLTYAMPDFLRHYGTMPAADELCSYLQYVDERIDQAALGGWYCGHYHHDLELGDNRHHLLYQQVVELGQAPVTVPAKRQFVPGMGEPIPDTNALYVTVTRREHATMEELSDFMFGKTVGVGPHGLAHIYPCDQEAFRHRINAIRRKQLYESGPASDIL